MKLFKQKIHILFILLGFFSATSYAQKLRDKAHTDIVMLKSGALLVRLKTSELKINALKKQGKEKEAEEIRLDQENTNKFIIEAFKANFNFCPVYFFYSNYSTKVKEGNYKGCIFDVNMQTDTSFSGNNYLIGEFEKSETTQLDAFYIKNKNFELLRKPFPYFVKQNKALVSSRSYDKLVSVLNEEFIEFFNK